MYLIHDRNHNPEDVWRVSTVVDAHDVLITIFQHPSHVAHIMRLMDMMAPGEKLQPDANVLIEYTHSRKETDAELIAQASKALLTVSMSPDHVNKIWPLIEANVLANMAIIRNGAKTVFKSKELCDAIGQTIYDLLPKSQ